MYDISFQGIGFSPETAKVVFDSALFMTESDLTILDERVDDFIAAMTTWEPKVKETGVVTPPKVTVTGTDYDEALSNMNNLFLQNYWGDGLSLTPPTQKRVDWILTGTDLARDKVIATIDPKAGIATAEALAVCMAMAGGRPEYLPVLIAIVEALVGTGWVYKWQTGSGSAYPAAIVNGPIGEQIRLNSGFGLLGPHPQYPAGGAIGRALRFLLHGIGGGIPNLGAAAGQYCAMRYTNIVFAEDEAHFPADWEPVSTEYWGYPKGTNAVTTIVLNSINNVGHRGSYTETDKAREMLESFYRVGRSIRSVSSGTSKYPAGLLIYNELQANTMVGVGWTKPTIKQKLLEVTSCPHSDILEWPDLARTVKDLETKPDPIPLFDNPDRLVLAVAGGSHASSCQWGQASGYYSQSIGQAEIKLPAKWDELLAQAEEDLGPLPVA